MRALISNLPLFVAVVLACPAEGFSPSATNRLTLRPLTNNLQETSSFQLSVVIEKGVRSEEVEREEDVFFIRKALPAELGAASDILSEAFFKENTNFLTYQWERLTTYLSLDATYPRPGERHALFVACHSTNGKVLGLAEIDDRPSKQENSTPRPYMFNVAVDPRWRRKGIAKALVLECEKIARQEWDKPLVYLKVRDTAKPAVAMYKSLGYVERSSSVERLNDKYQNLIVMSKTIADKEVTYESFGHLMSDE